MAAGNLDSADLKGVAFNGLIREDVMDRIWDISNIPLVLQPMMGAGSADQSYHEWTMDKLAEPDLDNAKVDGADTIGDNDTRTGSRVGNHCQICTKTVHVSTRADASNTIGFRRAYGYQASRRQIECRRDVDAIAMTGQASVADNGNNTPGRSAGLFAWLKTHTNHGATGAAGGFNNGIVAAPTYGTKRALTETMVRDMAQEIWEDGGTPTKMISTPSLIRRFSEYCFTSSARIATLTRDANGSSAAEAMGAVNVFMTDFGVTLELIPNRFQGPQDKAKPGEVSVAFVDPSTIQFAFLRGYRTEPLAKQGLSTTGQISVDWTFAPMSEEANGAIFDIDETAAVTHA